MRYRYRATGLYLLLKQRNNGSVTPKHITEPYRNKFRVALLVIGLNDHLADTLACPHYIGGINCLIRGYHDKSLRFIFRRRLCKLPCTHYIVFDRFIGGVFHKRNVLMCRSMVNYVRMVLFKYRIDPVRVTNASDEYLQVKLRIFAHKLLLDGICTVFINIENDKLLRLVSRYLTAKLASY